MLRTGAADGDATTDRTLALLVALGAFAFYVALQRGEMVSWDGRNMAGVARSIWQHGSVTMWRDSFGAYPDWRLRFPYSEHGLGLSLVLAPLWALQQHVHGDRTNAVWLTLANPALLAATAVMVFRIGVAVGWRRASAVAAAFAFALLTMAPQYSTELFAEPLVTFATVLAVLGCVRWQQGRTAGPWLVGTGVGIGIATRSDSVLLLGVLFLVVPWFVAPRVLARTVVSWLPAVTVPLLAAAGLVACYDNVRYGSPFTLGYGGQGFTTPLWTGLGRNLLSPGKGFFWYDPILLAGLAGLWWLRRRNPPLVAAIVVLSVARVLLYAKWWDTDGSIAWGPRFLLPLCPLLALGVGEVLDRLPALARRRRVVASLAAAAIAVLTVASGVVVLASVWVGYEQVAHEAVKVPAGTPPSEASRIIAHGRHDYDDSIGGSNIVRSLAELDEARPFPLRNFAGGPSPLGVGALVVFGAGTAGAFALARSRDRPGRSRLRVGSSRARARSRLAAVAYETSQTGAASMSASRSPGP